MRAEGEGGGEEKRDREGLLPPRRFGLAGRRRALRVTPVGGCPAEPHEGADEAGRVAAGREAPAEVDR